MTRKQAYQDRFFLNNILSFVVYALNPRFLIIMAIMVGLGSISFVNPFTIVFINLLIMAVSFKFAVDILLTTSEGSFKPEDVSFSGNNYGVIIQIIVIGIILDYLTDYAVSTNNDTVTIIVLYGVQFIMPAIYMVLAYSGSFLEALNPVTLIRFIKPWFLTYTIFSLFYLFTIYLETLGIAALIMNVVTFKMMYFISAFIMVFFLFLNFHIMGFLINQNFNETVDSEETYSTGSNSSNTKRKKSGSATNANPIYARVENLITSKTAGEALAIINELQNDGDDSAELEGYKQQVLLISKENTDVPLSEQIHNLIGQNKIGSAFKILEEIYANNNIYTEAYESDLGALAKHAFSLQKYPLVIRLLNGFSKIYPHSQELVPNYYLVAQVLYKNPKTKSKSLALLNGLVKKYPSHEKIHELKSWAKGIELMQNKKTGLNYY